MLYASRLAIVWLPELIPTYLPPSLTAALLFSYYLADVWQPLNPSWPALFMSGVLLWALDADYADYMLDVTPRPLMGMALCFSVLALLIAVSASNCGAVQDIAGGR